jgi:outer membrane protein OmpA-like peptidoglycan-associated protein
MKTHKFFALGGIFLVAALELAGAEVKGAQISLPENNYVVIGAFSVFKNATSFTSEASKKNLNAKYEMNRSRNLYYVYVLSTSDRQQAIDEALRLRKESPYDDTWVYHGSFGEESSAKGTDINPATEQTIPKIKAEDSPKSETASITNQPALNTETSSTASSSGTPAQNEVVIEEVKKEEPAQDNSSAKGNGDLDNGSAGKNFYFKLFRADDQNQIEGDVNVIDAERSRKMGTFAGNKDVRISDPANKEGKMSLVCEVFGFRKIQRDIDYQTPEGEGIQSNENATVVPFELVRLQKGDIAVMYNVFFFKDAAVMRPESRFEVTSLLNMLKENPKYKIKIHGHTNGGAHGKIISMKEDSDAFFALNNTKDGVGSAKKLSEERADVIKKYLVSNGVEASRMEVKAWGGKRPIYDKHSPQAQSNVRVEIEILEN